MVLGVGEESRFIVWCLSSQNFCALIVLLSVFDENKVSIVPVFKILCLRNLFVFQKC